MRNWASAGVSRRNMAMKFFDADAGERIRGRRPQDSFYLDVGGLYDGGPLLELVCEQLAELGRRADLDLGAEGREKGLRAPADLARIGLGVGHDLGQRFHRQ